MSSVSTSGSGAPKSSFSFGRIWDQYGMLVVFAVLGALLPLLVPVALVAAAYGILKNYA